MLKEKILNLEIHILLLYGLIFLIILGFIVSGVAKSAPPQATKATLDKQETILQYNLPVKKPVDNNFWGFTLSSNDGECGC